MKKTILISLIISLLFLVHNCQHQSGPRQIVIASDAFTLMWDEPDFDARIIINPIKYYRIYYRKLGDSGWNMVASVPVYDDREYELQYSDFGSGLYEFAVDYIQTDGTVSQLHTSRDHTSEPIGGWYIFWLGLE